MGVVIKKHNEFVFELYTAYAFVACIIGLQGDAAVWCRAGASVVDHSP